MNAHYIAHCLNQFLCMVEMFAHRLPRPLWIALRDSREDVPVVR